MATMATLANAITKQAHELVNMAKFLTYSPDTLRSIVLIKMCKDNITTLTGLCQEENNLYGKVDDRARQEIESILKKAEKKFALAERVKEYKLKGPTTMSDPRLEKMIGKLTHIKQNPLPQDKIELRRIDEKLDKWRGKLDKIVQADGGTNGAANAHALIEEIEQQMRRSSKFSLVQPPVNLEDLKQLPFNFDPSILFANFDPNPELLNWNPNQPPINFDPTQPLFNIDQNHLLPNFPPDQYPFQPITLTTAHLDPNEAPDNEDCIIGVVDALSKRNDEGFYKALELMVNFKDEYFIFRMSDDKHRIVVDRIYFHLYHIQNKETPDKVDRNDHRWGLTAFQTEELSTPDQKLRAAQRVQLEMFLEFIDEEGRGHNIPAVIAALEKMNLDPKDLPQGQNNAAHALFGKFYQACVEAHKANADLDDPRHEKFRGDFGRYAFTGEVQAQIPAGVKLKVLEEFVQELKSTWGI